MTSPTDQTVEIPQAASPRPPKSAIGRVGTALLIAGLATAVIAAGYRGAAGVSDFVTTDNAFLKGDVTFISPKVPGYVTAVQTENDKLVSPGDVLIRIDPTDYQSAVADAEAAVAQQRAALRQIAAQRTLQAAQIKVADAGVVAARATQSKTGADFARSDALVGEGAISRQLFDASRADNVRAVSGVAQSQAQAEFARTQIAVLDAQTQAAGAQLQAAQAKLTRAVADLGRTSIVAPREGRVAARNVRLGEFVNTGTRLLAITPTKGLWVEANLRETQLPRVRTGDRVQIAVDAVPDAKFCGAVEGVQGASGSDFAVIPPDNATGNFTKIARRFTVRILLDPNQSGAERLASGMSVTPSIAIGSHVDGVARGHLWSRLFSGGFQCGSRS